jgi:hypothetical protein
MTFSPWAVIGAGPAGIAAVGKLLDYGIPAADILWLDPEFKIGDFGTLWRNVPSNTKVKLFRKFLAASAAFEYADCQENFALNTADANVTCVLEWMAQPLAWVTEKLRARVQSQQAFVSKISYLNPGWELTLAKGRLVKADKIILATGSEPVTLSHGIDIISLRDAMDKTRLAALVKADDTVAVFGSSHSAMLALRDLMACQVKHVINFYRSPLLYAVHFDDWILFNDTGLKGTTAEWARTNIDRNLPQKIERVIASDENIRARLPACNKVIYAIGFKRRPAPLVENVDVNVKHDAGMLAPGLFGLGIAYPEPAINPLGQTEYRVGLWKFMDYLERSLPRWIAD